MYLSGRPLMIRWRLLSGNNRDMCHGVDTYPDQDHCVRGIERFVAQIPDLQRAVRRDDRGEWVWLLLDRSTPVATSGHSYDRQIRCVSALAKVISDAASAPVRSQLVISEHRRWAGSARVFSSADQPERKRRQLS